MRRSQSQRSVLRGPTARLRHGLAVLLLLVFAILLIPGADAHGHEDQRHTHHAPVCSLFCLDECTTAALPKVPAPPPPDGLPTPDFAPEPVPETLSRTVEPERTPPRA